MRAHQPGSIPIDIPETVPNPAYTPAPAPAPERAPTKVPEKVPEKVIAPESSGAFFFLARSIALSGILRMNSEPPRILRFPRAWASRAGGVAGCRHR